MTIHMNLLGPDDLFKATGDLAKFGAAMRVLAERAPERLTMSQALFFVLTGVAELAGQDATYTDIKAAVGDSINKSLNTTYRIFLSPSRLYPSGLGWLQQEVNPMDNRQKFLRLTSAGRNVLAEVTAALAG